MYFEFQLIIFYIRCGNSFIQGETAVAILWRCSTFHSEKYRERMDTSYPFLYFKVKRLSPSFGGAARFIPRNIEKGWNNHILPYIFEKKAAFPSGRQLT
ncbi:hypothetical protein ASF12_26500 [Paenibacillus sp. Leaf72]|nr:hypothetical protein ASF12_26500 [Paenibacillus sp. Leaf72]